MQNVHLWFLAVAQKCHLLRLSNGNSMHLNRTVYAANQNEIKFEIMFVFTFIYLLTNLDDEQFTLIIWHKVNQNKTRLN